MVKQTRKLISKEKLLNIMAARLCALSFLKRAFLQEPTKEYLELLADGDIMGYFPADNEILRSGYESLEFYLRDPNLLTEKNILELGADFMALFVGPERMLATPYESVYLSNKPLVFQEHTMEVRAEYAKHDLMPEKFQQEPDDHISLEIDFIARLTEKCMTELRAERWAKARKLVQTQQKFLDAHLLKWAYFFGDKVMKNAKTDFYRGIGKMLVGYLKIEQALVDGLAAELEVRHKQEKAKRLVRAV